MSKAYLDALTLLGSPSTCATAMSRSESMCVFTQTRQEMGVSRAKRHEGLYNKLLYDPYWSILALRKLQSADRCATTQGKINHAIPEIFFLCTKKTTKARLPRCTHISVLPNSSQYVFKPTYSVHPLFLSVRTGEGPSEPLRNKAHA